MIQTYKGKNLAFDFGLISWMIATGRRERWSEPSWRARDTQSRRGDREGGGIVEEIERETDKEREAESPRRPVETEIRRPQTERRRFHR